MNAMLMTYRVWFGPSRNAMNRPDAISVNERIEGYYTELPLAAAIAEVREYERKYGEAYGLSCAVNFFLLSVATLPARLSNESTELARTPVIERMGESVDEELAENGPWYERFTWDGKPKEREPA